MTITPGDDLNETLRQRTRDQFDLLREAHRNTLITDTGDPADFNYICSNEHVLVPAATPGAPPDEDAVNRLNSWFIDRPDDYGPIPPQPDQPRSGLVRRFGLPPRLVRAPDGKDVLATLADLDADPEFGPGFATPDHLFHICGGRGSICPATEPTETGWAEPWPRRNNTIAGAGSGADVRVVVIDTGWYHPDPAVPAPDQPWSWLKGVTGDPEPGGIFDPPNSNRLRAYAGHGTFVAGVIRSVAPGCSVHVLNLVIDRNQPGGGVLESQLVDELFFAMHLDHSQEQCQTEDVPYQLPHLINMSAGSPTREEIPSRAFEAWRTALESRYSDPDLVVVAAAGNNSSTSSFWPASFGWAVGVGSLDLDGQVSDFSNRGDSADVFALGRNVVNAFPHGDYFCHECPDRGDKRVFDDDEWLARWSGTSFSAPLVTGLIAVAMSHQQAGAMNAHQSYNQVRAAMGQVSVVRPAQVPVPAVIPAQP
jgi:subtilisin family serine protease